MRGLLFIGLISGYCAGSFVVYVCCCCRGFGVRVDELELVAVVWDELVCVARWLFLNGLISGGGGGYCVESFGCFVNMVGGYCVGSFVVCVFVTFQGQVERQAFVPKPLSLCNKVQSINLSLFLSLSLPEGWIKKKSIVLIPLL